MNETTKQVKSILIRLGIHERSRLANKDAARLYLAEGNLEVSKHYQSVAVEEQGIVNMLESELAAIREVLEAEEAKQNTADSAQAYLDAVNEGFEDDDFNDFDVFNDLPDWL